MSCKNILEQLLDNGKLASVLTKSNSKKDEVVEFQTLLHQLGFDEELNWDKYGADGYYGNSCINAVKAYGQRNDIQTDGANVSKEMAESMIARYDSLDELQELQKDIDSDTVTSKYKSGSSEKGAIASLQTLLNDLGYGNELNWDKYKNDGQYGSSTVAAVQAFMDKEGFDGDASVLSQKVADQICDLLGAYYGTNWPKNIKAESADSDSADGSSALVNFSGSNFQGKTVQADTNFVASLEKINQMAKSNNVKIHVTSSWRANAQVAGAIVTPATKSNHMAGHAIDMNIVYPDGWANSSYLKKSNEANWDPAVAGFINDIRDDNGLRWGGDFNTEDPVHIDDGLNINNPSEWEARYLATQAAASS